MSNISRRDFLKTAGVMTLAVAAAGVLAGCEGSTAPAPEAGKPEVKPSSVSYTSYTGDKLTVESLGRFNVYESHDKEDPEISQTVLKITWTKPEFSTTPLISANAIEIKTENYKEVTVVAFDAIDDIVKAKFQKEIKAADNLITDLSNTGLTSALTDSVLQVEKYIVLDVTDFKTNDLNVTVAYKNADGEAKSLIMPLSVAATDVY